MYRFRLAILSCSLMATASASQMLPKQLPGDLVFGAIGDYGMDTKYEAHVAQQLQQQHPAFIITMGDNNYPIGCWETIDKNIGKYYSAYIGNYKGQYGQGAEDNQFYPSIGNHDWNASGKCHYQGGLPYLAYFTLPNNKLYYDFVKGSVHFYALDSDQHQPDGNTINSIQYNWLKTKLNESTSCFNVVYFHHSPYSSGEHGSNKDLQWDFGRMGVDAVITGHDHDYERIMRDNVVYLVNGASGAPLYGFKKKVDGSVIRYSDHHGYLLGYINQDRLSFAFYNTKGEMKDSVTLTKKCPK